MPVFKFKRGFPSGGLDPQAVGDAFQSVRDRGLELTAEIAVEEAKDPDHPAHGGFEWNNKAAGHQHRLEQARSMIRAVYRIIDEGGEGKEIRAFVHVVDEGSSYQSIGDVVSNEQLVEKYRHKLRMELLRASRACQQFDQLKPVLVHLDAAIAALELDGSAPPA